MMNYDRAQYMNGWNLAVGGDIAPASRCEESAAFKAGYDEGKMARRKAWRRAERITNVEPVADGPLSAHPNEGAGPP